MSKFSAINDFISEEEQPSAPTMQDIRPPQPEDERMPLSEVVSRTIEQEWVLPGFDRIKKDKSFKRDPSFTFDNPEKYLEGVPLEYQPRVRENLVEARSEEHAKYIVEQTVEEYKGRELLGKQGALGIGTQFVAMMADPVMLAADFLAMPLALPVHAGRALKMSRAARASRVAGVAAAENMAIEEYLRQNSLTRSVEDVMYAGAFGAVLGGAFGALGKNPSKQPAAKPGTIADDMNQGVARSGHETLDHLDNLVESRATGKDFVGPPTADTVLARADRELHEVLGEFEAARAADGHVSASAFDPATLRPVADDMPIKARLSEVDAKIKKLAEEDIPAPKRSELQGMVNDVSRALAEFDDAVKAGKGGPNAEIKVNGVKRKFLARLKEHGIPEALKEMEKKFVGINPKLSEFRSFHSKMVKLADKLEKRYLKDNVKYDEKLTAVDDEVAALMQEAEDLKSQLGKKPKLIEGYQPTARPDLDDSAGAMRSEFGSTDELARNREGYDVVAEDEMLNEIPQMQFRRGRFGLAAQMGRSPNRRTRHAGRRLFEDPVGLKNGEVSEASAEFEKRMMKDVYETKIRETAKEQYPEWLKERGYSWVQGQTMEVQESFGRAIYMARQTGTGSPAEMKISNAFTDAFQYGADQAQEFQVKGFVDKKFDSDTYTPRRADPHKYSNVQNKLVRPKVLSNEAKSVGEEWHRRALLAGAPGLDNKLARRIAKHLDRVFRKKSVGLNERPVLMSADKIEDLKQTMLDGGVDPQDVSDWARAFEKANDNPQAGINARAKRRMGMDMSVKLEVEDLDGNPVTVTQHDLYDTNMFNLADNYGNSVLGQAAIAKVHRFDPGNKMRSYADYERMFEDIRIEELDLNNRSHTIGDQTHSVDTELDVIKRLGVDAILGKPPTDPRLGTTKISRAAMAYAYVGDMGKVALAQLAESGGLISATGVRTTLRNMPGLKTLIKKVFKNQPDTSDALANVVRRDMGLGTHNIRGSGAYKGQEHDALASINQIHSKTDYVLHKTGRMVGWLNETLMDFQQVTFGKGVLQNDYASALKGKSMRTSERRLASAGVSPEMQTRILRELKAHGESANGKHLDDPKFDSWTDKEAADVYKTSIRRRTQRNIQENYAGSSHQVQHNNLGKVMLQYRSFIIGAWENSLMHNLSVRDWESVSYFINTSIMASLSTYAFLALTNAGHTDYERRMKEATKPETFFKTAVARTAWSGLAPGLIDWAAEGLTGEPFFSPYRSSGLKSSIFDWRANPTGSRVDAALGLVKAGIMLPTDDYRLSMEQWYDLKALSPFRTMPVISNFLNYAGDKLDEKLPSQSQPKFR